VLTSTWADCLGHNLVGLGDSAWAVCDGNKGWLSNDVGLVVDDKSGCLWAVGGVLLDGLSDGDLPGSIVVRATVGLVEVSRDGNGGERGSEDGGETHFG